MYFERFVANLSIASSVLLW